MPLTSELDALYGANANSAPDGAESLVQMLTKKSTQYYVLHGFKE